MELVRQWLRREPGVDIPAVYVEHNAPRPSAADSVHPIASRSDITLVHVSDFNRLMGYEIAKADGGYLPSVLPSATDVNDAAANSDLA